MTRPFESADWNNLHDVYGKSAASLPRLLRAMRKGEPEQSRQEAAGEFWLRINDDSMLCDATAPALAAYFASVEADDIEIGPDFLFGCSTLFDECDPTDEDNAKTRLIKSDVKATIQSQRPFLWNVVRAHPDSTTRSEAAGLLIKCGERPTEVLLQQLESASDPQTKSGLLDLLQEIRADIPNWEDVLLTIVANDKGAARFHAAALLVIMHHATSREMMEVLREFPSLGSFAGYKNLLFEACAALAPADRVAVLEDILTATKDRDDATYVCQEFLTAVFEVPSRPLNLELVSGPEGSEFTWLPKRPYANRKRLDSVARARLCAFLSSCDALWRDKWNRPIRTNLWRQFGLPEDRDSMRKLAQRDQGSRR